MIRSGVIADSSHSNFPSRRTDRGSQSCPSLWLSESRTSFPNFLILVFPFHFITPSASPALSPSLDRTALPGSLPAPSPTVSVICGEAAVQAGSSPRPTSLAQPLSLRIRFVLCMQRRKPAGKVYIKKRGSLSTFPKHENYIKTYFSKYYFVSPVIAHEMERDSE